MEFLHGFDTNLIRMVYVVHEISQEDSDTGHDTIFRSVIFGVFHEKGRAEEFVKERKLKHKWSFPSITEVKFTL